MRFLSFLSVLCLFVLTPISVSAQDNPGKKKGPNPANQAKQMVAQFMKQLEKAELTETQTTKITELMTKVAEKVAKQRLEADLTPEIMKKRTEAGKAAREAGKKPREVKAEIDAAVTLTAKQKETLETTEADLAKVKVGASR